MLLCSFDVNDIVSSVIQIINAWACRSLSSVNKINYFTISHVLAVSWYGAVIIEIGCCVKVIAKIVVNVFYDVYYLYKVKFESF